MGKFGKNIRDALITKNNTNGIKIIVNGKIWPFSPYGNGNYLTNSTKFIFYSLLQYY